ncbi:hypothetical protein IQ269_19240 [Tychonema sp. LEGE 07199]|uniref:hypothetical protein n=1 Tax=unclassified Tychonema TaxID=2642144 RepID=UPI00187EF6C7|nr:MULTISPECIES: hypothetical protein [unclassified Tychonema]MBE9122873.1 hypothetical protein [Tychonema sp. LEGE 07199]MBE9134728.1 hypothetical protein [Tychonema sp. LEGE 07196]
MATAPQTAEQSKKELDEVAGKKGTQRVLVQAYLEPTTYINFYVREDFYNYYGVKVVVASTATKAEPKRPVKTGSKVTNKGNGVSYSNKGQKLPDKKIKVPTTGGDAPLVNSKGTKRKKWMTFRVPTYMSSAAVALWINTAFDANRKPTYFMLESGTRVNIDSTLVEPSKLKPLASFKSGE